MRLVMTKPPDTRPRVPSHKVREIAVRSSTDERTVRKVLDGREVRPMPAERIRRALEELGIAGAAR
jgi:ribosome maturation protein Sdo1